MLFAVAAVPKIANTPCHVASGRSIAAQQGLGLSGCHQPAPAAAGLPNSLTHRSEWAQFARYCQDHASAKEMKELFRQGLKSKRLMIVLCQRLLAALDCA